MNVLHETNVLKILIIGNLSHKALRQIKCARATYAVLSYQTATNFNRITNQAICLSRHCFCKTKANVHFCSILILPSTQSGK